MAQALSVTDVAFAFLLIAIVGVIQWRTGGRHGTTLYASVRMVVQLVVVGFVLVYIFESSNAWVSLLVLAVMLTAAGYIAMRPVQDRSLRHYALMLIALSAGGLLSLLYVLFAVFDQSYPFEPRFAIPLAGMSLASAMNTLSQSAERYEAERSHGQDATAARAVAFDAAMIPRVNGMLAVGVVSLPGMMTGQILAGVSPLLAVRYQIVIMCLLYGASGIAASVYLRLREQLRTP